MWNDEKIYKCKENKRKAGKLKFHRIEFCFPRLMYVSILECCFYLTDFKWVWLPSQKSDNYETDNNL